MAPIEKKILMKAYRERLKAKKGEYEQHLQKERQRDKKRRELTKVKERENEQLVIEKRKKVLERVKRHRRKLKTNSDIPTSSDKISPIGSYKSKQTFGKALNRLKKNLPDSPNKKSAIVKKLALDMGLDLKESVQIVNLPRRSLSEAYKKCIVDFYCSDPISRQAPGKNDTKSVKCPKTGKQVHMQIRHLIMTVKEAFEEFKLKYPEVSVKKSMFFSLRPKHVLPVSQMPHNVCVCKYHANVNFLLESISKVDGIDFPTNHKELLTYICCDTLNERCILNKCSKCSGKQVSDLLVDFNVEQEISWKKWSDEGGRIRLTTVIGNMKEAIKELQSKLSHFKAHCYVKKVQEEYFEQSMENLKNEKNIETYAVVQIDFAENYSLTFQDEIQSAHWSHQQVGIFTCCTWLPNNKCKSYVVISNDTSHSKFCVWTFLCKIVNDIKENFPFIDRLKIFSDNCAGQFKNKYSMSALCKLETDLKLSIEWNFFATSHGKGAVDGIGGTVKRHVWTAVKGNRRIHIESAKDVHDYVGNKVNGIKSFYVDKSEVLENESVLQTYWEMVIPIPNIQSSHYFRVYDSNHVLVARTSTSLMTKVAVFQEIEDMEVRESSMSTSRLRYEDVYSDSDYSIEEDIQLEKKLPVSVFKNPEDVYSGMYVLVEVPCEQAKSRKSTRSNIFRYAAICQGSVDDENYVSVMFLKSHGSKSVFIANDDDIKHVSYNNIVGQLPDPSVKQKGLFTILYEFSGSIDVFEK